MLQTTNYNMVQIADGKHQSSTDCPSYAKDETSKRSLMCYSRYTGHGPAKRIRKNCSTPSSFAKVVRTSKNVRFSDSFSTIDTTSEMAADTNSEMAADTNELWYSKHDMLSFRIQQNLDAASIRALLKSVSDWSHLPLDRCYYRGLERLLSKNLCQGIAAQRCLTRMAVLAEQESQRQSMCFDSSKIANASCSYTSAAKELAITIALD